MFAPEREFRVLVVVEGDRLPSSRRMAFFAFRSVPTLMLVIGFVTRVAGFRQFLAEKATGVAGAALDHLMLSDKRKLGVFPMVEGDGSPGLRGMARAAFGAVTPAVHVVQLMAGGTDFRRILVAFVGMAAFAGRVAMFPL